MIQQLIYKLRLFFTAGHSRTLKAKKNIIISLIYKVASMIISFAFVPMILGYVDETRYGIWFTLSSIVTWFYVFDVGLGNGLRNKLAIALADEDTLLARKYISTSYAALALIMIIFSGLFFLIYKFISWELVFNAPVEMKTEITGLVLVVVLLFAIRFVLNLINSIVTAFQEPAIKEQINFFSNLTILISFYVLMKLTQGNLIYLGLALTIGPIVVLFILSLFLFRTKYAQFSPAINFVDFKYINSLMSLGLQFFIIQISAIILFTTSNIIITQLFNPAAVTPYNIAFKYMSISTILFSLIISPFWSAITDAYARHDLAWIKNMIRKLIWLWFLVVLMTVFLLVFSDFAYGLWFKNKIEVPFGLTALIALFVIMTNWITIYVQFINGVGKLRLQLIHGSVGALINIPLSIWLARYFGVPGVIMATIICQLPALVWAPIQYLKIINQKATGVWAA